MNIIYFSSYFLVDPSKLLKYRLFSSYLRGWRRTLHDFVPCIVLICVAYTIRGKSMFNVEIIFIFENFIIFRRYRKIFERYKVIL